MKTFLRCMTRIVLLIGVPLILFYAGTVTYVATHMNGTPDAVPADCGIVFGTAVWPVYDKKGSIVATAAGPGMTRRVTAAVELFQQGRLHRVFMTGGKGDGNQRSEAGVMKELGITLGIPAERITVEDRARSTWENILNTRPLTTGCTSVVGISDGYHLARIALIAHMQGWELPTYPATVKPNWLFNARNQLREAAGIDLLVLTMLSR